MQSSTESNGKQTPLIFILSFFIILVVLFVVVMIIVAFSQLDTGSNGSNTNVQTVSKQPVIPAAKSTSSSQTISKPPATSVTKPSLPSQSQSQANNNQQTQTSSTSEVSPNSFVMLNWQGFSCTGYENYSRQIFSIIDVKKYPLPGQIMYEYYPVAYNLNEGVEDPVAISFSNGINSLRFNRAISNESLSSEQLPYMSDYVNSILPLAVAKNIPANWRQQISLHSVAGVTQKVNVDFELIPLQVANKNYILGKYHSSDFPIQTSVGVPIKGSFDGFFVMDNAKTVVYYAGFSLNGIAGNSRQSSFRYVNNIISVDAYTSSPLLDMEGNFQLSEEMKRYSFMHVAGNAKKPAWSDAVWVEGQMAMLNSSIIGEQSTNPIVLAALAAAHLADAFYTVGANIVHDIKHPENGYNPFDGDVESPLEKYVYRPAATGYAMLADDIGIIDHDKVDAYGNIGGKFLHLAGGLTTTSAYSAATGWSASGTMTHNARQLWGHSSHLAGAAKDAAINLGKVLYYGSPYMEKAGTFYDIASTIADVAQDNDLKTIIDDVADIVNQHTNSGQGYDSQVSINDLDKAVIEQDSQLALLSKAAYGNSVLPSDWRIIDSYELSSCGYYAVIYRNDNLNGKTVLVFRGTEISDIRDWSNNVQNYLGFTSEQYKNAVDDALLVKDALGDQVIITGHSLGGGLAIAAGLATGLETVTFNPAAPGKGIIDWINTRQLPYDSDNIRSYVYQGDPLDKLNQCVDNNGNLVQEAQLFMPHANFLNKLGDAVCAIGATQTFGKLIIVPDRSLINTPLHAHGIDKIYSAMDSSHKENNKYINWLAKIFAFRSKGTSICLVVDNSGSMKDYNKLTQVKKAIDEFMALYVNRLDDQVGVTVFSDNSKNLLPLTKTSQISLTQISGIMDSMIANGGTEIKTGLNTAFQQLQDETSSRKAILLLTDGKDELPDLTAYTSKFRDSSIPVHTVAYGADADSQLLQDIAKNTGGEFFRAGTDSISSIFSRIQLGIAGESLLLAKDSWILPFATQSFDFIVPSDSDALTVGANWQGSHLTLRLIDPFGNLIPQESSADVSFFDDAARAMSYFRLLNPISGKWKIEIFADDVPQEGEFYTIKSSVVNGIRAILDLDEFRYMPGQQVTASLTLNAGARVDKAVLSYPGVRGKIYQRSMSSLTSDNGGRMIGEASFAAPDKVGLYDVVIDLAGVSSTGKRFDLQLTRTLFNGPEELIPASIMESQSAVPGIIWIPTLFIFIFMLLCIIVIVVMLTLSQQKNRQISNDLY